MQPAEYDAGNPNPPSVALGCGWGGSGLTRALRKWGEALREGGYVGLQQKMQLGHRGLNCARELTPELAPALVESPLDAVRSDPQTVPTLADSCNVRPPAPSNVIVTRMPGRQASVMVLYCAQTPPLTKENEFPTNSTR